MTMNDLRLCHHFKLLMCPQRRMNPAVLKMNNQGKSKSKYPQCPIDLKNMKDYHLHHQHLNRINLDPNPDHKDPDNLQIGLVSDEFKVESVEKLRQYLTMIPQPTNKL